MEIIKKAWDFLPEADLKLIQNFCNELNISPTIAKILTIRGILDIDHARSFLYSHEDDLYDSFLLKNMSKAVERIIKAVQNKEKIVVFGDYDVDGVTSCAILDKTLKAFGADFKCYIPDRKTEGYGLTFTALENLRANDIDLLITVDCGISSIEEINWLNSLDNPPDVIITDHHEVLSVLPDAYAILNPKQPDCSYPDKNLAGVGIAFKLALGLLKNAAIFNLSEDQVNKLISNSLELVALGTVADIASLTQENRFLVKYGILKLKNTNNLGIKALCNMASFDLNKIDTSALGFIIGPRLNAAGRISHANKALQLLLTGDINEANALASELNKLNKERQDIEGEILSEALDQIKEFNLDQNKIIFLVGENWHLGVIGIVASKLIDKYFKPVVIITKDSGIGKGSCRSIKAFNIFKALEECAELFVDFGGHKQAAGLTIELENIELLREKLIDITNKSLSVNDCIPEITIDSKVTLEEIDFRLLEELDLLAPFGQDNPAPVFTVQNVKISDLRTLGQNKQHLKIIPHNKSYSKPIEILGWNYSNIASSLAPGTYIDIIFYPKYNEWQGNKNIQLILQDICFKFFDKNEVGINHDFPELTEFKIDREIIGKIYVFLKNNLTDKNISFKINAPTLLKEVNNSENTVDNPKIIDLVLTVLKELDLIGYRKHEDYYHFFMISNPAQKKDLVNSPTFNKYSV